MKVVRIRKKYLMLCMGILIIIAVFTFESKISFAMQHYYKLDFSTGIVTATTLNVRSGPSTKYPVITTVKKNEYIRVFAGIGDWYVIQTDTDHVGAVSKQYVKAIYPSNHTTQNNTGTNTNQTTLTSDEQEVFRLINAQRTKNRFIESKD